MARDPEGEITASATEDRLAPRSARATARESCAHEAAVKEVQFQAVLEAIGDGFISLDSNYHCTYVNQAAATLLNTTAGALTGRPIWEAIAPARYARLHEEITRAAEQKIHVKFEEYCVRCGHWFRWHCSPTAGGLAIFMEDISERKEAEAQVARSEEHYRLLFETMPVGVVYQDANGKVISMNPAAERILGRTPAEFLGRTSADEEYHTRRDDGSPFPAREYPSMVALRTGQEVRDVVMGVYNPQVQAYRWIRITAVPLVRPGEDKPYQVYAHFSDITELRQAAKALRYSERRFRKLFESDPIGIFITKPDGTFLDCNEAMAKMLGYDSREELLRHRSTELYVDPEFRAEAVHLLQTNGIYLGQEGRVWRKDGSIAHLLGAAVLLKDEETGEPYIQGVAVDITERRRAEQALADSRQFLERITEATPDVIYIYDVLERRNVYANRRRAELLGYSDQECEAMGPELLRRLMHPDDFPRVMEQLRRLESAPEDQVLETDYRMRHADGTYRWFRSRDLVFARTPEGRVRQVIGVAQDVTERKRTEEALRASEERYRKLFEANMAGVYLAKLDGTIVDFNDAMMKMLGYDSHEEVFRRRVPDFYVHPEVRLELLRQLRQYGIIQGKEVLLRKKDGSTLYALGSAALIPDERTGEPTILGVALDVTDRRKVEEALRENEERLRLALAGGQMGRWEWDLQTDSLSWCERSSELLGLDPPAKIPVKGFLARVHPEDREAVKTRMIQALQREIDLEMEFRVLPRPGEPQKDVLWLASRGKVIRDARGQAIRMIGVMFDITRRKRMEERLRQLNDQLAEEVQSQTEQLRTTVHQVQDEAVRRVSAEMELYKQSQMLEGFFQHTITPLAFLDRQFNFIRVNSAFAQSAGQEPGYFIGKNYFALYPRREDRAIFERVVRTKQPYFVHAKPVTDPENPARALMYWDWQLTPLLDSTGQVQSLVLNCENVTEQQKAFVELEHRARQLQKLMLDLTQAEDRERRRLADILHDDLQQLLAAAKFHLSLLDRGAGSHRNAQDVVRQAKEIIKDAIERSRSLSHELSPAILYQGGLDETFDWLARQMQNKYGLTVHVETDGPVELQSEPLRAFLFRATQELLFNVVKHARVNEATVRVRRCRQYLCLSVSDRGRGLDSTQLKEIAGFGLLGIRERVELLGGRMKIKSAIGKGSKFSILVPLAPEEGEKARTDEDRKLSSSCLPTCSPADLPDGGLRVVLADDHEIVRQGIAALLREDAAIQVIGEAADGREAINLAYQLRPDVIIMDVSMPRMNGEEATRQIKRHLPEIRIVALSMYEEPETIERMRQAGAEGYVLKTAPPEELLAAIRGQPLHVETTLER